MKNSFQNPSHSGNNHEQRRDQHRRPRKETGKHDAHEKQRVKQQRMKQEDILTELEKQIDEDASNIGLVIAGLFKTLTLAHSVLPSMDLTTDLFHINVDMASISVNVFNPACLHCPDCSECSGEDESFFDDGFDDDEDDDEEDSYEFDD